MKNIFLLIIYFALSATGFSQTLNSVYEKVKNSIATIYVYDENRNLVKVGAGFAYTADGQIVTSYSLISSGMYVKVKINYTEYIPDAIWKLDRRRDVVVYKIAVKNLQALSVGSSDNVKIGDQVFLLGNPLGYEKSFLEAIISSKRDFGAGKIYFQISLNTNSGVLGSPLLDLYGNVIGILNAISHPKDNIMMATQINSVKQLLESSATRSLPVPNYFIYEQPKTNYNIGLSYESKGEHSTAIWYYLKSLKDEVKAETYRRLAYCHEQLGNMNAAEEYYRKAKQLESEEDKNR